MMQVVDDSEACQCATAREFLEKLRPAHDFWQPKPSRWIFRGHGDSSWQLLATAHRPGAFDKFHIPDSHDASAPQWLRLRGLEMDLLKRFHRALDDAGLMIPSLSPAPQSPASVVSYMGEPEMQSWALRALAQHHGIPTALLDWTRRGHIAAYFAAATAVEAKSMSGRLDVWALRTDVVFLNEWQHDELELFRAPRASNPNLHAQAGAFTVFRGDDVRSVNDHLSTIAPGDKNDRRPSKPWMRRLSIQQSCAPELLRLLSDEGITGATMFPGHDGVVRALREQRLWDSPPDDER
jgi:FRG domain